MRFVVRQKCGIRIGPCCLSSSRRMIVPLIAFLGATILSLYLAVVWDTEAEKLLNDQYRPTGLVAVWHFVRKIWRDNYTGNQVVPSARNANSDQLPIQDLTIVRARKRKARSDFQARTKSSSVGCEHSVLEDALPRVFQSAAFVSKMWCELERHHKWIALYTHYSAVFPRALRVLSLATNVLIVIFFVAITYSVANPQKGVNCSAHLTEDACTAHKSHFRTGQAECMWVQRDDECRFIEPNLQIRVILFVVIFSVALSVPVSTCTNYIFKSILAAPSPSTAASKYISEPTVANEGEGEGNEDLSSQENIRSKPLNGSSVDTVPSGVVVRAKSERERAAEALAEMEGEIHAFREQHVKGIVERRRFDRMWGLTQAGRFIMPEVVKRTDTYLLWLQVNLVQPDRAHIRKQALLGILRAQKIEAQEVEHLKLQSATEAEVGKSLLFHLHCDMLPGVSGRILENKGLRDTERVKPVTWQWKALGCLVLLAVYVVCIYYVIAFAAEQNHARQNAWFKSFMLYIVFDFVGLSCAHVMVTHFLVPSIAMRKVTAVKEYLVRRMQRLETEVQKHLNSIALKGDLEHGAAAVEVKKAGAFNAAEYLYASYRLSAYVPSLRESRLVRLCGETQNTRQQTLKEVMFGVPSAAPISPLRQAAKTGEVVFSQQPDFLLPLLTTVWFLATWSYYLVHLLLWTGYKVLFRPCLLLTVTLPEPLQDAVLELVAAVALGYVLLLHIALYDFFPPLAFLPVFVIFSVSHFYFVSGNGAELTKLAGLRRDALKVKAEQRKLAERRLQKAEQDLEQKAAAASPMDRPGTATAPVAVPAEAEGGISSVHTSIRRSSVLRSSVLRDSAKHVASALQLMDQSIQRSASGEERSRESSAKFESRLQHFMKSADKVLHSPAPAAHSPSHHHHPHAPGSTTPLTGSFSKDGERSYPNLRTVDSFLQAKQGTAAPSPMGEA